MSCYTHLTTKQRYQIYGLLKGGFCQRAIAKEVGVHKSTISRELKRNHGKRGPKQANETAMERKSRCKNAQRITREDWNLVDACLQEKLSPEQISGRLKLNERLSISHETIYRHVYEDKADGGCLHAHLRSQKPYRKRIFSKFHGSCVDFVLKDKTARASNIFFEKHLKVAEFFIMMHRWTRKY